MSKAKSKGVATGKNAPGKFVAWDSAEHLKTPAEVSAYLATMIAEADDDPGAFAMALGTAARAYGIMKLSEKVGLSRQGLSKALSKDGNPRLDTVLKVTRALGVKLSAKAA